MTRTEKIKHEARKVLDIWHRNETETIHAQRIGVPQQTLQRKRTGVITRLEYELAERIVAERKATKKAEDAAVKSGATRKKKKKILSECEKNT